MAIERSRKLTISPTANLHRLVEYPADCGELDRHALGFVGAGVGSVSSHLVAVHDHVNPMLAVALDEPDLVGELLRR